MQQPDPEEDGLDTSFLFADENTYSAWDFSPANLLNRAQQANLFSVLQSLLSHVPIMAAQQPAALVPLRIEFRDKDRFNGNDY